MSTEQHLEIVMSKTADSMIDNRIGGMWGSLEMASINHFIETGKINGSFHSRLKKLMIDFAKNWHNTAAGTDTSY